MSRSKFTPEQKATISQEYLDGFGSSIELATKYNVDDYTNCPIYIYMERLYAIAENRI